MEFEQTIVYKPNGPHQRLGGTFDYKGVHTQEEFDRAIADGWHADYAKMLAPKDQHEVEVRPKVEDETAPEIAHEVETDGEEVWMLLSDSEDESEPTREELEQKARELDIKFDGRTSDRKLGLLIDEKLKG